MLDRLKRVVIRLRETGFGFGFIFNIFKIPTFLSDHRVSVIRKAKVIIISILMASYFISGIDLVPELMFGIFGFADDTVLLIVGLNMINKEIEKYKKMPKDDTKSNIIKDVKYSIKDE